MATTRTAPPVPQWVASTLRGIGAPINATNVYALQQWAVEEHGPTASVGGRNGGVGAPLYNWLSSILPINGSKDCTGCQQQSIQQYPNVATGVQATVDTLKGWPKVVAAFRDKNATVASIQQAIATSVPGPCGEQGCSDPSTIYYNPQYPNTLASAAGSSPPAIGDVPAAITGNQSSAETGWCNNCAAGSDCKLFTIPHTSFGPTKCQAKAALGGILLASGVGLFVFGLALVVKAGMEGKGPLAKPAEAVTSVATLIPGVGGVAAKAAQQRQQENDTPPVIDVDEDYYEGAAARAPKRSDMPKPPSLPGTADRDAAAAPAFEGANPPRQNPFAQRKPLVVVGKPAKKAA
jgi:hypothetical protein